MSYGMQYPQYPYMMEAAPRAAGYYGGMPMPMPMPMSMEDMAPRVGGKRYRKKYSRSHSKPKKFVCSSYKRTVGTKLDVWRGCAKHTSGGLKIGDLMQNKFGRIVSKKKHALGKKAMATNPKLAKYFGKIAMIKKKSRTTSKHGGSSASSSSAPQQPMAYDYYTPRFAGAYNPYAYYY